MSAWFICAIYLSSYIIPLLQSINDVSSFGITTGDHEKSGTAGIVTLTLWFNFTIYECILYPTDMNTLYSCNATQFTIIGSSNCHKPQFNNIPDTKIIIDNSGIDNAVIIANIFVNTINNIRYGIQYICISDTATNGPGYDNIADWKINDVECGNGFTHYKYVCIDNDINDCGPSKQLLYFDINKPNIDITNSLWNDGTNIPIDIITCNPTTYPTIDPTNNPTIDPTVDTLNPTNDPSFDPTIYPTNNPTLGPTIYPTNIPSMIPSKQTNNPTLNPSISPTDIPTNARVPTINAIDIEIKTTQNPTISDIYSNTTQIEEVKSKENGFLGSLSVLEMILLLLAILLVLLLIVFILGCYLKNRKKNKQMNDVNNAALTAEMTETVKQTDINTVCIQQQLTSNTIIMETNHNNGEGVGLNDNQNITKGNDNHERININDDDKDDDDEDDDDEELYANNHNTQR